MLTERHKALRFFLDHGGYWYNPNKESEFQGRWRSARTLADAERRLKRGPYFVSTEPDDLPWNGDVPWDGPIWVVTLWRVDGSDVPVAMGSLTGVGAHEGDPYLRVVAAELAAEHIKEEVSA